MVISDLMTLSRSDFVRRIRLSFWTSRWRAALGVRFADHGNVLIFGVGLWHTGLKAALFSGPPLLTTHPMRCSTYFVGLRQSVGFSQTRPTLREMPGKACLSGDCVS